MGTLKRIYKIITLLLILQSCAVNNSVIIDEKDGSVTDRNNKYSFRIPEGYRVTKKTDKLNEIKKFYPNIPQNTVFFYNREEDIIFALYNSGFLNVEPKIRKPFLLYYYEQDMINLGKEKQNLSVQKVERTRDDVTSRLSMGNTYAMIRILLIQESGGSEKHNSFVLMIHSKKDNIEKAEKDLNKISLSLKLKENL